MRILAYIVIVILSFQIIALKAEPPAEDGTNINIRMESSQSSEGSLIFSGADEGEYIKQHESGEGILILTGNIKMRFDNRVIYCQNVVYNRNTGDVTLTGDVMLDDGKNRIRAGKCIYNIKDNAGVLYDTRSIEKPIFFDTKKIRIVNKKTYVTDSTKFTTCDLERPHYYFKVKKLIIYRDKRAIAFNAIYVVGDIPVFYFPVIGHSDDGIGIIMQFGQGMRRGSFMQNTVKYTSENGDKWKYKLDFYEKLGNYGGLEYTSEAKDSSSYIYLAGAKFEYAEPSGTKWVNKPLPEERNDDWFKAVLNNDYSFNSRGGSNSYSSIRFEWMNDSEFEKYFDYRGEPQTTLGMFGIVPMGTKETKTFNWNYTVGDRGANHDISLQVERQWYWDTYISRDEIHNYSTNGRYVPYADQLPIFNFKYFNSFYLFDNNDVLNNNTGQQINWTFYAGGNSYKYYSHGENYSTTYTPEGYLLLNTDFPFLKYFTYTPGIQNGFIAQWVRGPFDNNESVKESAEIAAEKNSYEYVEASNTLKFGLPRYYLQATHYYRRSYLEKEVIEPFVHEKRNNLEGGVYLLPTDDIKMSVTTSYDARIRFPFENERLKDITVSNSIFFDFYGYLYNSKSSSNRKAGLFYSGLEAANNYSYITKDKKSGYNTLDLKFTTGNFALPGIDRMSNFEFGYNFYHDFRFPFRDTMSIKWGISAEITKLWRLEIGGGSQADRAYLLYNDKYGENFFDDLTKSLYFYDRERSKNAVFSLRNLFVNIFHDLHCWEIGFYYNLQRLTENWGPQSKDRLMYYEHLFFVSLTLKTFTGQGFQKTQVYPLQQREEKQQ